MLASEVIDRTYNEWLYPGGVNRPTFDVLATAGMTTSSPGYGQTFVVEGRVPNIPSDTQVEIGDELILVKSVSGTTVTVMDRGYLETVPATHAIGDKVLIDPRYPRITIFNALKSIITGLYALGVYRRVNVSTFDFDFDAPTLTMPAGAKRVLAVIAKRPSSYEDWRKMMPGKDYEAFNEFQPPRVRLRRGGYDGGDLEIVYAADFTLPTTTADDLDTGGVPTTLQPYLPMAVAGYLLQGRELPRVQIEEIRRQLGSAGVQVGAALNVGQSLLQQFRQVYVAAERARLEEADPSYFEYVW